MTRGY